MRAAVEWCVDAASAHPLFVVLFALSLCAAGIRFGFPKPVGGLELHTDFLELLPRESPGFKAFEHQLGRVGGGATLIVVAESPERAANERFIDALSAKLQEGIDARRACMASCSPDSVDRPGRAATAAPPQCVAKCGEGYIAYVENGTKDVHTFFEDHKWLYADLADLEEADHTLDQQIAIRSGLVSDLSDDDDDERPAPAKGAAPTKASPAGAPAAASAPPAEEKRPTLGMDEYYERWKKEGQKYNDFPSGYFCTPDGKMHGLRVVTTTTGTGDSGSETVIRLVNEAIAAVAPATIHPELKWGLAGDIPNAQQEKESLMSDAALASGLATVLILGGIVFYFRSPWSLFVIAVPALLGVSAAYSFARVTFGYVNTAGLFLGAIILGNGINYPIVLLSRYREFRARGMTAHEARRGAVWNAFRAELVGASVAAIAYGSLTVTRFRGFSQFGMIGFVGMLLVWLSIIPLVPALLVLIEAVQAKLPPWLRDPPSPIGEDGTSGPVMSGIARVTERWPRFFVALGLLALLFFGAQLPRFMKDPWEYNLSHLGSRASKKSGAAMWSIKADAVFGGKMNIAGALMLADSVEQIPLIKEAILENDKRDPEGTLVSSVATVFDLLPGPVESQKEKLAVLDRLRDRLTPAVLASMSDDERRKLEELRPPESLAPLAPVDLPGLLRRRFEERDGRVGTVFYVKFKDIVFSDGHIALRIAKTTDNVRLADGTVVQTASRSTIFAEMLKSMERDGPLASFLSFGLVVVVVVIATSNPRGAAAVLLSLVIGVVCTVGGAAMFDMKVNFLNFIALPITFGIGSEYPFNVFDRTRLLGGDVSLAVKRSAGAVAMCSLTTVIGYGSLIFNDNQALQSFGKLAVAGEVATLLAALFVLPAFLHLIYRKRPLAEPKTL